MAVNHYIFVILLLYSQLIEARSKPTFAEDSIHIEFLGKHFSLPPEGQLEQFTGDINEAEITKYVNHIPSKELDYICESLLSIQKKEILDDWLYYQLVRRTAQECIHKKEDYIGYTLLKWYILSHTGYEPLLSVSENKLLLYIKSDDIIYNQPLKKLENKQYVCLNYHDYGFNVDFNHEKFINIMGLLKEGVPFTFLVKTLPDFAESTYEKKELKFQYKKKAAQVNIKLNTNLLGYFTNYPVTEYKNQFNIPLSKETYQSLIPALQEKLVNFDKNKGVEYLMYFTRHAFIFETDTEFFGREKRLSPEETLLYDKSDCEDRSALFFLLVKEIYDLPMIVLSSPQHVTVAVKLDKPTKHSILYEGNQYTICEPTPQRRDLKVGEETSAIRKQHFTVEFAYEPMKNN